MQEPKESIENSELSFMDKEAIGMLGKLQDIIKEHGLSEPICKMCGCVGNAIEVRNVEDFPKVKEGLMHRLLGIKPGEEIHEVFKSGKALAEALLKKVPASEAMKMVNFAANVSKTAAGDVFREARSHLEAIRSKK